MDSRPRTVKHFPTKSERVRHEFAPRDAGSCAITAEAASTSISVSFRNMMSERFNWSCFLLLWRDTILTMTFDTHQIKPALHLYILLRSHSIKPVLNGHFRDRIILC